MIQSQKTVEFREIGPVIFERSFRAQRLIINVRPLAGVRVAVPEGVSFRRAVRFAESKSSWIIHQQQHQKALMEKNRKIGEISNIPQAKDNLCTRLKKLSNQYGYIYNKVFIRQQKTRWGSCSAKNNINLNLKLVLLPAELMDYVILHELVHTKHKNHGKAFWTELNKITGDAKGLASRVKSHGVGLL